MCDHGNICNGNKSLCIQCLGCFRYCILLVYVSCWFTYVSVSLPLCLVVTGMWSLAIYRFSLAVLGSLFEGH